MSIVKFLRGVSGINEEILRVKRRGEERRGGVEIEMFCGRREGSGSGSDLGNNCRWYELGPAVAAFDGSLVLMNERSQSEVESCATRYVEGE